MITLFKKSLLSDNRDFEPHIKASTNQHQIRLNVYRNNIAVSLIDTLADIFPITQAAVGEQFFRAMARVYALDNLPNSPIMSEYGDNFGAFIRSFEPAQSLPFLADLAALEHAMLTLTHEQEYPTLAPQTVASIFSSAPDPDNLQLSVPPTTQILASPFAIGALYHTFYSNFPEKLGQVDINHNQYLLLVKSHLYAQLHVLSKEQAIFIKNLIQHKALKEALPDSSSFNLGETLAKLIEWRILTGIS